MSSNEQCREQGFRGYQGALALLRFVRLEGRSHRYSRRASAVRREARGLVRGARRNAVYAARSRLLDLFLGGIAAAAARQAARARPLRLDVFGFRRGLSGPELSLDVRGQAYG